MKCGQITYSNHALQRMFARGITTGHVAEVIKNGKVITSYPTDKPYPSFLLLNFIDNRPLHVLIGYNEAEETCIVITAYEPDELLWHLDFNERIK